MIKIVAMGAVALMINGCAYQYTCPSNQNCSAENIYSNSTEQGGTSRMKRVAAKGAADGSADPSVSTQQPTR
jgi:hypothetical protein